MCLYDPKLRKTSKYKEKPASALARDVLAFQQTPHSYPPDISEEPSSGAAVCHRCINAATALTYRNLTLCPSPYPRFSFFRRWKSRHQSSTAFPKGEGHETATEGESDEELEERYEKPSPSLLFIRLENSRATCAIGPMAFDKLPRKGIRQWHRQRCRRRILY